MCRLLGFAAAGSASLSQLVGEGQCNRFLRMSHLHADGWGTAWVDGLGGVATHRDPNPPQNGSAAAAARIALAGKARARLVHLRMATSGLPVSPENTHPFVADGVAFAHNGAITPKAQLAALVDPAYRTSAAGDTDSELYFALVRQHAGRSGDLLAGACSAVTHLRSLFPKASLNAMLLSRDQLIVVHSSEHSPIPVKELAATGIAEADLPLGHLDSYFQMSYTRLADGSLVFSSTGLDTTGWTPLAPATVTAVDLHSLQVNTQRLEQEVLQFAE
ncbi:class II glutamine amidotransferase [Streptomyces sp. NPDC001617]